jgi:hypothetical protein
MQAAVGTLGGAACPIAACKSAQGRVAQNGEE